MNSEDKNPTSIEINNALFSIENCGIADDDARDILEDLLYSINVNNVLKDYSAVKEAVANKKTTKYISYLYIDNKTRKDVYIWQKHY